ncbi:CAP domain-containing protein [Obelidium mucronatum]|nr:CAP domain-containing protein [Obelidium mucronatum]
MLLKTIVSILILAHSAQSQYNAPTKLKCRPKKSSTTTVTCTVSTPPPAATQPAVSTPPPAATQPVKVTTTQAVVLAATSTTTVRTQCTSTETSAAAATCTTTPPAIIYGKYDPAAAPVPMQPAQPEQPLAEPLPTPAPEPQPNVELPAPEPQPEVPQPQPEPQPQPQPAPQPDPAPAPPLQPEPVPEPLQPAPQPSPPPPPPVTPPPPPPPSNGIPDCNAIASITQNFKATGDMAADAVNLSNQVRQYVGRVIGVTMPPVEWSSAIAQGAAIHAQTSVNNRCNLKHNVSPTAFFPKSVGQNLYMQMGIATGDDANVILAISAFVSPSECNAYNTRQRGVDTFEEWGHYTQVLWPSSTQLGCAVVRCASGGFVTACDYFSPGNIGNSDTIKIGNGY